MGEFEEELGDRFRRGSRPMILNLKYIRRDTKTRHDYRNHIQTMKVLAANGAMDAILNSKISLAQSRKIAVHCDAHIPVKLRMSEPDLCVIIGNLFNNAVEARFGFTWT